MPGHEGFQPAVRDDVLIHHVSLVDGGGLDPPGHRVSSRGRICETQVLYLLFAPWCSLRSSQVFCVAFPFSLNLHKIQFFVAPNSKRNPWVALSGAL